MIEQPQSGVAHMSEWPPREVFPNRRKPHRLPPEECQRVFQPVLHAACTKGGRTVLLREGLPRVLEGLLLGNARAYCCEVIS